MEKLLLFLLTAGCLLGLTPAAFAMEQGQLRQDSAWLKAVDSFKTQKLLKMLDNGFKKVDLPFDDGYTALHVAADRGDFALAKKLIDLGARVNECPKLGHWAPILLAADKKHTLVLTLLLSRGANPNICNCQGLTALHLASQNKDVPSMRMLLSRNADPNVCDNQLETPLHEACRAGNFEGVRLLLEHKADIHGCGKKLELSALASDCICEECLVYESKQKGEGKDKKKDRVPAKPRSPFERALKQGCNEIACELIAQNPDLNIPIDKNGIRWLHLLCRDGSLETVKKCIARGADINITAKSGDTPLIKAILFKSIDVARHLIESGAGLHV